MAESLIPDVSFVDNTEERVPLVLVLDCSGSMSGDKIDSLNNGLNLLKQEIDNDPIASKRVRVMVITFGGQDSVEISEWQDVQDFSPMNLVANGTTPTGAAVFRALEEIEKQKEELRDAGIAYKRPLLFILSDGEPTDEWQTAATAARDAEANKKVAIFSIGVGDANTQILGAFSAGGAKRLDGLKFKELFQWLSASVRSASQTAKGQATQLPSTDSWAQIGP